MKGEPAFICKSITFKSLDSARIRIEETPERDMLVLSIVDNEGKITTARLNLDMASVLYNCRYSLDCEAAAKETVA